MISLLLVLATSAFAGDGDSFGTRGGGYGVLLDGRPYLLELHDRTACLRVRGSEFRARAPETEAILGAIARVHWYLADALDREIRALRFCVTEAPLKPIPLTDADFVTGFSHDSIQVAVRLNDTVYLHGPSFDGLTEVEKGALLVHEAIHGFIPVEGTQRRPEKVHAVSAALARHATGEAALSRDSLALQLAGNGMDLIPETSPLDAYREGILAALRPAAEPNYHGFEDSELSPLEREAAQSVAYHGIPRGLETWLRAGDRAQVVELRAGHIERVFAMSAGALADEIELGFEVGERDARGRTLVIAAADAGDLARVDLLLQQGTTDVNAVDSSGRSALVAAVQQGDVAIVKALLADSRVDSRVGRASGLSARSLAWTQGKWKIFRMIGLHRNARGA